MNHRQSNHGLRRPDALLPVYAQPPVLRQPSEGSLHRPADWQRHPAFHSLGPAHDLQRVPAIVHHPAVQGAVVVLLVGVDQPHLPQPLTGKLRQCGRRGSRIVHVGGCDHDRQQPTRAVPDDMGLSAIDVLGVVTAAGLPSRAGVHRLAVDARGVAGLPRLLLLADAVAQRIVDALQGSIMTPEVEVAPDGALGREVLGQETPLASSPQEVEDGVEDVAHRGLAGPTAGGAGDHLLHEGPLLVGQIARVSLSSHTQLYGREITYRTDSYLAAVPAITSLSLTTGTTA